MQAGPRDIAQGMAEIVERWRSIGADTGQPRCDATGGGKQEVARAAGGVDNRELQKRLGRIVRLGLRLVEHGIE